MQKSRLVLLTVVFIVVALSAGSALAQGKGKQKNVPFLITGKLPHLTKLLVKQWENPELHLSDEQKTKLLVVRKETISNAQRLGKEIGALEQQVVEGSLGGKAPEQLQSLVQQVAQLKTEATMVHLRCISNTSKVLDQQQLALLMK